MLFRSQGVDTRRKGQHGPLLRRGELHLGQVVDEEVELGGHTSKTGLYQSGGASGRSEQRKRGRGEKERQREEE